MENPLSATHPEEPRFESVPSKLEIETPPAELLMVSAQAGHAEPGVPPHSSVGGGGVHMRSRKWLFRVGLAIAVLNPVFSGVLFGVYLLREPELKREGKIILTTAILWGALALLFIFLDLRKTAA